MNKLIILFIFIMIFLLMLSTTILYSHKLADLADLAKPVMMATDSSKLYILDGVKAYIYSMKDFRLLGTLGKKGNGPGEFNPTFADRIQLHLHDGNILLNTWNKMAWFSQEGMLIREKKFPFLVIQIVPLDQNFAVTRFFPGQDGRNQLRVKLMDEQLKAIKTLYTREDISFRKSQKLDCPNVKFLSGTHQIGCISWIKYRGLLMTNNLTFCFYKV
jgi:hypothetical protein